ncbi:MAG: dihydroneopterin aldolase [Nevskia sp.]|nr:dihydroneopterin aldolase [Nevskia sp.]
MSGDPRERLPAQDYLCAKILRAEVDVQLGLHGWERHREKPTRLWVDAELFAFDPPAVVAGLHEVIDYDRVRDFIRAWAGRPHTPLLETLAQELVDFCLQDPKVDAVRVSLVKPTIFNEARGAGVELFRRRR